MQIDILGPFITEEAAGGAGVATGQVITDISAIGLLQAIAIEFEGAPPATADIIISTEGTDPVAPTQTLLSLTDIITDAWYYPRLNIHDNTGIAIATVWDYFPIRNQIKAILSQVNDGDQAKIWLQVWKQ